MENTAKLIDSIKKYAKYTKGENQINNVGLEYRYDHYDCNFKYGVSNWLMKLFREAAAENIEHCSNDDLIYKSKAFKLFYAEIDGVTYCFNNDKPAFKGQFAKRMGFSVLYKF